MLLGLVSDGSLCTAPHCSALLCTFSRSDRVSALRCSWNRVNRGVDSPFDPRAMKTSPVRPASEPASQPTGVRHFDLSNDLSFASFERRFDAVLKSNDEYPCCLGLSSRRTLRSVPIAECSRGVLESCSYPRHLFHSSGPEPSRVEQAGARGAVTPLHISHLWSPVHNRPGWYP